MCVPRALKAGLVALLVVAGPAGSVFAQRDESNGDWSAEYVTLRNTPEAELMVRVGSINNVGFGFENDMNPFSARNQWHHPYPWEAPEDAAGGTDRIMLGTAYEGDSRDGYSWQWSADSEQTLTRPIVMNYDLNGLQVHDALLQIVIDDFQALRWGTEFEVTMNGRDAPFVAEVINHVDQTGPTVQVISIEVPEPFLGEVESGRLELFFDELTGLGDGFAIDFVKLLVNVNRTEYLSFAAGTVLGHDHGPLAGATVRVLGTRNVVTTDENGEFRVEVVAGLNAFRASADGFQVGSTFAVTPAGDTVKLTPISLVPGENTPDINYEYFAAGGTWERASEWATPELGRADELELIPAPLVGQDMTLPITRAEFAAMVVRVYEQLSGERTEPGADPFDDTDDVEVLKAYREGLAVGVSDTEFMPDEHLNREQAATMLTRVVKKMAFDDWTYATDERFALEYGDVPPLQDDERISPWARESVYFMIATGVIADLDDDAFRPRATTGSAQASELADLTREQALVLAVRLFERQR